MYVCVCKGITESDVKRLGRNGITCQATLAATLGIDDEDHCCGRCLNHIVKLVDMASRERRRCSAAVQA